MKNTIIIILLTIVAFLFIRSCIRAKQQVRTVSTIEEIKQDSTQYYRDLFYTEHATRQVAEADLASQVAVNGKLLDSIKKRTGIREKDIQAATAFSTIASATVTPRVIPLWNIDTGINVSRGYSPLDYMCDTGINPPKGYAIYFDDKFTTISGRIGDSSSLTYQVKDSIIFTTYTKRTGLFQKDTYLDGYSFNPAVHITGITAIKITSAKPQRIGVGPYLGYGWNGAKWTPSAGISIHYSLIKF